MATKAPNYNVNYDDKRFTDVEADKNAALSDVEKTYSGMVNNSDAYYQAQIDASKQWASTQQQLQQAQTDSTIEKIEQQKDQAQKDYTKEQSGAYVDWQKQSNDYGVNAEKMAAAGLQNTGYSESSQVSMYNTYQNRVASARESYNLAVLNYNNAIKDAKLQNNAVLAEIAYEALQTQLELSLQGFQYKNQLILDQANKKLEVENMYYDRYQDVLNQINTENALAEEVRQYNLNYDMQVKELNEQIRQFNEEIARAKANDKAELEMQKQEIQIKKDQLEEEKRQFNLQLEAQKAAEAAAKKATVTKKTSNSPSSANTSILKNGQAKQVSQWEAPSSNTKTASATVDTASATVDTASVLALGYGPISEQKLAQLVAQGVVTYTQVGNKLVFKKAGGTSAGQAALNKYTWK